MDPKRIQTVDELTEIKELKKTRNTYQRGADDIRYRKRTKEL